MRFCTRTRFETATEANSEITTNVNKSMHQSEHDITTRDQPQGRENSSSWLSWWGKFLNQSHRKEAFKAILDCLLYSNENTPSIYAITN